MIFRSRGGASTRNRRTELVPFVGQGREERQSQTREQKVGETETEQVPFYEAAGGPADSLRQLVAEWEERQAANAAIRQGIADVDAGLTEPFLDSQDRFREERGLPPRQ